MTSFFSAIGLFVQRAYAAVPPTVCGPLIGCPGGASPSGVSGSNIVLENIPDLVSLMIVIAAGSAVLFIVWAGFQMVIAIGNDSKVSEARWSVLYVLLGLIVVILAQSAVGFVGTQSYGAGNTGAGLPVTLLRTGVSILLTIFNAAFIVSIIIGGIRMVYAQGKSDEFNTGRKMIYWSVIGAVVANLANAAVQAIASTFGV